MTLKRQVTVKIRYSQVKKIQIFAKTLKNFNKNHHTNKNKAKTKRLLRESKMLP